MDPPGVCAMDQSMTTLPEGNQNKLGTAPVSQPTQTEMDAPGPSGIIEELDAVLEGYTNRVCNMGEMVKHFDAILESALQFNEDQ